MTPSIPVGKTLGMDQRIKEWVKFEELKKADNEITAFLKIEEKLPSLEGHFPGRPIVPAVTIIDISLHLIEQLGVSVDSTKLAMKRSKFTAIVSPEQRVWIQAQSEDGQAWKIQWFDWEAKSKLAQVHLVF